MAAPFDAEREEVSVLIEVSGRSINDSVIFTETTFQTTASAQVGTCSITCRGSLSFSEGSVISLKINGRRQWQGFLMIIERGYIFPDSLEPKTILHGSDLNILLDKLFLYNHAYPELSLTGGGKWPNDPINGTVAIPKGTSDKDVIEALLKDTDIDLISPRIRTQITEVGIYNPEDVGAPPTPGGTLRAMMNDIAGQMNKNAPGSIVYYIDPDAYLVYLAQDSFNAPFNVSDGGSGVAAKNLTITSDISGIKNDVLIFAGATSPDPAIKPRPFLNFRHNSRTASIAQYGRWQYSEAVANWSQRALNARSTKVLFQEGDPAMRASFTIYKSGLIPGMILDVDASAHGFLDNFPIRAVTTRFLTPTLASFDVECSYNTSDPWGLLLALKRPAMRGIVQPIFQTIDITGTKSPPAVQPWTYLCEDPKSLGGNKYQTSYGYIRDGISVWSNGLRQVSGSDFGGTAVFTQLDPDKGTFKLATTPTGRVHCCYHVSLNLVSETIG